MRIEIAIEIVIVIEFENCNSYLKVRYLHKIENRQIALLIH